MTTGREQQDDSNRGGPHTIAAPPQRSFSHFMSSYGIEQKGISLRFLAKLDTSKANEKDRRFIVSYFVDDDSIVVYEPPVRNSG